MFQRRREGGCCFWNSDRVVARCTDWGIVFGFPSNSIRHRGEWNWAVPVGTGTARSDANEFWSRLVLVAQVRGRDASAKRTAKPRRSGRGRPSPPSSWPGSRPSSRFVPVPSSSCLFVADVSRFGLFFLRRVRFVGLAFRGPKVSRFP